MESPTSTHRGTYNDHTKPQFGTTTWQLALMLMWMAAIIYYILSLLFGKAFTQVHLLISPSQISFTELNEKNEENGEGSKKEPRDPEMSPSKIANASTAVIIEENKGSKNCEEYTKPNNHSNHTITESAKPAKPHPPPIATCKELIPNVILFGLIMFIYYLADYRKTFPVLERTYNADLFLFLIFLLFLVGSSFTLKPTHDKILNRDQTEEWKGWMQVMFVWYHYFAAKTWYNWIRVYIAAYVWMTGFGNFSFFWIRQDYSLWRVLKMLFRLNFLVICVCLTVDNPYMLYYICPMHTYWFLSVYAFMAILPSWNQHRYRMALKFTAYAVANVIIFEIPGLHMAIFRPVKFLFGFDDGKHDIMHEWFFRSKLDHWACFIGMLCAYNYPHFESFMKYLETKSFNTRESVLKIGIKVAMVIAAVVIFLFWHYFVFIREKYAYNILHPYTSWIPIIIFIVLRNIHPHLRKRYINLFAWLGKITLETYISQLHIYLQSNAKELISYIPGYPLLTFSAATIIYLIISHKLFLITNVISAWLFPKNYKELCIKVLLVVGLVSTAWLVSFIIKSA